MKSTIVCVSVSHGNTLEIAKAMSEVIGATVVEPEKVDVASLADQDLVGFGSGIYFQAFHPRLRRFVKDLPDGQRAKAFVFTTSGFRPFTGPLVRLLERRGFEVVDVFTCRAHDTSFPFGLFGGVNKDRPNEDDLTQARSFAEKLRAKVGSIT